ncbi:MAG: AGE family epimerase/isomerase [Bowdeniella nasicola]|nr:AGE family epimerase/isomerase [Bowdeniella nasicola]
MIPGSPEYRRTQRADLLRFAAGSCSPAGFGYLNAAGEIDPGEPTPLYVVCRMTHVFALGSLAGEEPAPGGPDSAELADLTHHGVTALLDGPLRDTQDGGWYAAIQPAGTPISAKEAYGHAFVLLAASSALAVDIPRAEELLDAASAVIEERFWDEAAGMMVDEWDRHFTVLADYRGANANMHSLEAFLACGDVTGVRHWHERAARIAARVRRWAEEYHWRVPEHAGPDYRPNPELHRERPADPFKPFGATVGHGMEWARLLLALDQTLGSEAPAGLVDAAIALNDRAVADGWGADGGPGFVYTTDWQGAPVVRSRMHWVLAEAICTATALHRRTEEERYARDLQRWWDYADTYLIDHDLGSWHHELDPTNAPAHATWSGKPDVYHAYQAALIADVPTVPCFAAALAQRAS